MKSNIIDKYFAEFLCRRRPHLVHRPLVIGHRGTNGMPENTLESLLKAIEDGADGVELDIVFSSDNCPFVSHDNDVSDRLAGCDQPVFLDRIPADTIRCLRIHGSMKISSLADTLDALRRTQAKRIYIHYKRQNEKRDSRPHMKAVSDVIRSAGMIDKAVVMVESGIVAPWRNFSPDILVLQCWTGPNSSKSYHSLSEAREHNTKDIGLYHSREQLNAIGRYLHRLSFTRLGAYFGFGPIRALLREGNAQNLRFIVFTINDPVLMQLYAEAGVDAIGSDYPRDLQRLLQ